MLHVAVKHASFQLLSAALDHSGGAALVPGSLGAELVEPLLQAVPAHDALLDVLAWAAGPLHRLSMYAARHHGHTATEFHLAGGRRTDHGRAASLAAAASGACAEDPVRCTRLSSSDRSRLLLPSDFSPTTSREAALA